MVTIYRMYKFVKLVCDLIKEYQLLHPDMADSSVHFHPNSKAVIDRFAKDNNLPLNKAQNIASFVKDEEWLIYDKAGFYCINRKSNEITEGIKFIRPGLINEWAKSFGTSFTLLLSVLAITISILALVLE